MKPLGFMVIGLMLSITIVALIAALVPSVDDFDPDNPLWNGLSVYTRSRNVTPITANSVTSITSGTVLVIGASRGFTELEVEAMRGFVERGGYLIVLEDFKPTGYSLLGALGLKVEVFNGTLVDPIFYYKDYMLPRVTIRNVTGYFNYGTAVKEHDGTCIGYTSQFSFVDLNMNKVYDEGEPRGPLCVAVEWRIGRGFVLLVTDSSLAINSMVNVNRGLLEALASGDVYMVSDKLYRSLYSTLRSSIINVYRVLTETQFRYALVLTLLALYPLASRMVAVLRGDVVDELEEGVRRALNLNPSWDPEVLKLVAREWYERWRSSRG